MSIEVFKVRIKIMNLPSDWWKVVDSKTIIGIEEPHILTTVEDFYNEIGFSGGMFIGGRTEEEDRFIKLFYEYGNSRRD